ncbi:MAG: DNA-binding protein WhiA [Oscillospiraceae bacterium]|nr:DNA-binding protein WhiA [Oscillospiraceae bacterium]
MSFSQDVKSELQRIKETGKAYKFALSYGISYGLKNTDSADGLIDELILSGDDEIAGLFFRGVFISCGSVTDPKKEYHLELAPPNSGKCTELLEFMSERGISMKKSSRKGQMFLYSKDSEQIEDFLTYIGAIRHSMKIMNVKIYKEVRNNVNRAVNCEAANIGKTARAAGRQLDDIEYIFRVKGMEFLPKELREVAIIRRDNIDLPLKEIGERLDPQISKSGVYHRLRRITEIADELRSTGNI